MKNAINREGKEPLPSGFFCSSIIFILYVIRQKTKILFCLCSSPLTLISSLHSTIEFLKGEINVNNEIINKLLNRGNQCEHENLLKDDTRNCDDESFCCENLSNGQLQETYIDQNKNKRFDDRRVTSRTKQRLNRVNTNYDDIEITNEQDSNNTVKSVES